MVLFYRETSGTRLLVTTLHQPSLMWTQLQEWSSWHDQWPWMDFWVTPTLWSSLPMTQCILISRLLLQPPSMSIETPTHPSSTPVPTGSPCLRTTPLAVLLWTSMPLMLILYVFPFSCKRLRFDIFSISYNVLIPMDHCYFPGVSDFGNSIISGCPGLFHCWQCWWFQLFLHQSWNWTYFAEAHSYRSCWQSIWCKDIDLFEVFYFKPRWSKQVWLLFNKLK